MTGRKTGDRRQENGEETAAVRGVTRPGCSGCMRDATGYWNVRCGEQHGQETRSAGWGGEVRMAAALPFSVYSQLCSAENARRTVGELSGLNGDESGRKGSRNSDYKEIRDVINSIRKLPDVTEDTPRTQDEIEEDIQKHLTEMHRCFPKEYFFSFCHGTIIPRMVETVYEELVKGLLDRLQFPLTLGGIIKSPELSEQYLLRNLLIGMFDADDEEAVKTAGEIAHRLVFGYPDHRFSILAGEAQELGLPVSLISGKRFEMVWKLHGLQQKLYKWE